MPVMDTRCMYSSLKNTSGTRKTFCFLPPHGKTLDANEEYTVFGDVYASLITFDRGESRRKILAFEHALKEGWIEIVSTPNPILEDDSNPGAASKMLRLRNGSLGTGDPCWNTATSLSDEYDG